MIKLAILGATSQIAKDLIITFSKYDYYQLSLFARRSEAVTEWLNSIGLSNQHEVARFDCFTPEKKFDVVLNFVGVGNPAQAFEMGSSILDVTFEYDEMVLTYLRSNPQCRYIFLSSGAAYGSNFEQPVTEKTSANIPINNLDVKNWYAVAKLYAECRHRALNHLPIVDVRIFNYFSANQDISARFLITDILRAICENSLLKTSSAYIARDFLHPSDFFNLIVGIINSPPLNTVVDCYSKSPIDKSSLLFAMQKNFGLRYEINNDNTTTINATGLKPNYYSLNRRAIHFGYVPSLSSLDGILIESEKILQNKQINFKMLGLNS